jgi:hypothetical protein
MGIFAVPLSFSESHKMQPNHRLFNRHFTGGEARPQTARVECLVRQPHLCAAMTSEGKSICW